MHLAKTRHLDISFKYGLKSLRPSIFCNKGRTLMTSHTYEVFLISSSHTFAQFAYIECPLNCFFFVISLFLDAWRHLWMSPNSKFCLSTITRCRLPQFKQSQIGIKIELRSKQTIAIHLLLLLLLHKTTTVTWSKYTIDDKVAWWHCNFEKGCVLATLLKKLMSSWKNLEWYPCFKNSLIKMTQALADRVKHYMV